MPTRKENEQKLNQLFSIYAAANDTDRKGIELEIRSTLEGRTENEQLIISGCSKEQLLLKNIDLCNQNLSNIIFIDINFENAIFEKADLTGASFAGHDNKNRSILKKCNFKGAICHKTVFNNVDMRGSIFDNSTVLTEPHFEGAWVCRGILQFLIPKATYSNNSDKRPAINLRKISFEGEDLRCLNFSNLYLMDCYFKSADLSGASFIGADIKGSYFTGAKNLSDGQFIKAINANNAHFDPTVLERQRRHKKAVGTAASITDYLILKRKDENTQTTPQNATKKYKAESADIESPICTLNSPKQ